MTTEKFGPLWVITFEAWSTFVKIARNIFFKRSTNWMEVRAVWIFWEEPPWRLKTIFTRNFDVRINDLRMMAVSLVLTICTNEVELFAHLVYCHWGLVWGKLNTNFMSTLLLLNLSFFVSFQNFLNISLTFAISEPQTSQNCIFWNFFKCLSIYLILKVKVDTLHLIAYITSSVASITLWVKNTRF